MRECIFNVTSQCIRLVSSFRLVSGSAEIYEAKFIFDSSWDDFSKTAVFECEGERREQLLVNNRCLIPWEILKEGAYIHVGVYGVNGNKVMPTVYSGDMLVLRGAEPSEESREHSPDVFDQIIEIGQQASQDAETAHEYALKAAEASSHSPIIGQNSNWFIWDSDSQQYVDTGIFAIGEDGVSPLVSVFEIEGGHRITVTDREHSVDNPLEFDVLDGVTPPSEIQIGGSTPQENIKLWVDEDSEWPQPDWSQNDSYSPDYIKNKPTIPPAQVNSDWNATSGKAAILNKPTIPAAQVQSDWNQSDNTSPDFIKNKPTLFSGSYDDLSDKPTIPAAQIQSDWNQSDTTALDFIKNKPSIGGAGALPLVASVTTTEEVEAIELSGFSLSEAVIVLMLAGASTNGTGTATGNSKGVRFYFNGNETAVGGQNMTGVLPASGYTSKLFSYIYDKKLTCGHVMFRSNGYNVQTSVANGIVFFDTFEKSAFPNKATHGTKNYSNFSQFNVYPLESGWKFGTGSIVAIYGR